MPVLPLWAFMAYSTMKFIGSVYEHVMLQSVTHHLTLEWGGTIPVGI